MADFSQNDFRCPTPLRAGDKVRLVSPASPPEEDAVLRAKGTLQSWGLVVELGEHVFRRNGYLAGSDDQRIADLNDALCDPSVRAVIATRGGKGSYRIADRIDFEAVRRDPKFLVGFSDITILQMSLWASCGLVAVHGGLLENDVSRASLRRALMTNEPMVMTSRPDEASSVIMIDGNAFGPLLGGNLTMIATAAGWCLPKLDGAILFFEFVNLAIGEVDRQLTMLRKAGHFSGLAGVALGQFSNCSADTIEVVRSHLEVLGVPVLGGLPFGHGNEPEATLIGAEAEIDVAARKLIVHRSTITDSKNIRAPMMMSLQE